MLNGIDDIALTKLDVLDELDEIPVCTSYRIRGSDHRTFPAFAVGETGYDPQYQVMKGWKTSTVGTTSFDALPQAARDYIRFVEDQTEARVSIVSTGPRREETIRRS